MTILKLREATIDKILALDFEWLTNKDSNGEHRIIAAGFADTSGYQESFIVDSGSNLDSDKDRHERELLHKIVQVIRKYDWSVGFYSIGIRTYSNIKKTVVGRDSDLIQLHRRLERFHIESPIRLGRLSGIPYIAGDNNNHTHLDAHRIFSNQIIRTSVYGNAYNSNDLDTISKAILGDGDEFENTGKYKGLSGGQFESLSDFDKHQYVLQDALLLRALISHNDYEILKVMNSLATLTGLFFKDVCNSKGVTKIWTPILDKITGKEIDRLLADSNDGGYDIDNDVLARCDRLVNYRDRKISYDIDNDDDNDDKDKFTLKREQELLAATTEAEAATITQNQKQKQKKKDVRYIGGWVIAPIPGEYKNVSVFDITSLYPTMIVNNNISFETVDCICCADNQQARVPGYIFDNQDQQHHHHICVKHTGVLTGQISEYMNKRIEYKRLAKQLGNDSAEQIREYEIISNAYKILINSAYGQLGHKFAKYENVMAAELVTRYGRATIKRCLKIAQEVFHWDIIYGDTDSLFVNNSEQISDEDIQKFTEQCKQELKVTMELDKVYEKLIITGAKNYVGISKDSHKLTIKGLGGKKSDRCMWVRNAFHEMLNDYRDGINPCIRLRQEINKLECGMLEDGINQLIMFKKMNKNVDEYKPNVVQKLIGIEKHLEQGDTVRYYMMSDPKTKKKYTYDYNELSKKEYKKQLINAVKPVLSLLKYDVKYELVESATVSIKDIPKKLRSPTVTKIKKQTRKKIKATVADVVPSIVTNINSSTIVVDENAVKNGIKSLFQMFQLIKQPLFPRRIMTAEYSGAFTVYDIGQLYSAFKHAQFKDCRISAYPVVDDTSTILIPNLLLLDMDLDSKIVNAKSKLIADEILKNKTNKIVTQLQKVYHINKFMVIWSGHGRHVIIPFGFSRPFEQLTEFSKYLDWLPSDLLLSEEFLVFAKKFLSSNGADTENHPSFRSMFLRVPGTINTKNKYSFIPEVVRIECELNASNKKNLIPDYSDVHPSTDLLFEFMVTRLIDIKFLIASSLVQ